MLLNAMRLALSSNAKEISVDDLLKVLAGIASPRESAAPEVADRFEPAPKFDVPLSAAAISALSSVDLERASADQLRQILLSANNDH